MKTVLTILLLALLPKNPYKQCACDIRYDSLLQVFDREIEKADEYIAIRQASVDSAKLAFYASEKDGQAAYRVGKLYAPLQNDSAIVWFGIANKLCKGGLTGDQLTDYKRSIGREEGYEIEYPHQEVFSEELTHQYSINCCYRGMEELLDKEDTASAIEWLIRSAITDVRLGITDNGASWVVAKLLAEQDANMNIVRAYNYIEYSCNNEDIFDATWSYMQIGPTAHIIARKFRDIIGQEYLALRDAMVTIVVVLILMIIAIVIATNRIIKMRKVNREMKLINEELDRLNREKEKRNRETDKANKELAKTIERLDRANKKLSEMNHTREHFIKEYIEEKSVDIKKVYKESLKAHDRNAEEKLEEMLNIYYNNFDTTFLRLYPGFVDSFNALLEIDAQLRPNKEKGELLTPELRIYALVRMGITKSTQIAELMFMSKNTVYGYRSRLRNQAIDKENFEENVMKL